MAEVGGERRSAPLGRDEATPVAQRAIVDLRQFGMPANFGPSISIDPHRRFGITSVTLRQVRLGGLGALGGRRFCDRLV